MQLMWQLERNRINRWVGQQLGEVGVGGGAVAGAFGFGARGIDVTDRHEIGTRRRRVALQVRAADHPQSDNAHSDRCSISHLSLPLLRVCTRLYRFA